MPWITDEDVAKHKANLTKKQSAQWRRIANSVLKRLMDKGKSEKEAAVEAIKQANGVVVNTNADKSYSVYRSKQKLDYEVKLAVHQEKAHMVIPVVMMVEGVHNGNQGAIFHSIEELGKVPASWNGIPVVINHPEEDGVAISANSPDIIDNVMVGKVYNTNVDGDKLKAEVWLDEDKLNSVSQKILDDINETKEVEVSLGMFTDNEETEGEWHGEKYVMIAHNHRPDHLAMLPDAVGACSCEDGCGLGVNNKDMKIDETIKSLNAKGFSINSIGNHAEQNYQQRINAVNEALHKLDVNTYHYLEEVYDTYLIYSISGEGDRKMFKQDYKIEGDKVDLTGEPVEVQRKVSYVNANKDIQHSLEGDAGVEGSKLINLNKEVQTMANDKCPECLKKINALIANKESKFEETDREWLLTQEESTLDKLVPVIKEVEKIVEKEVEVNKLTSDQEADLAYVAKLRSDQRNKMVQTIQANTSKELWPDEVLKGMNEDHLRRIFDSVKKEETTADYSLNANIQSNTGTIEPLLPAGVVFEVKK